MPNWRTRFWLLLAAIVAAAVPVAFGGIRAVTTGDDVRYLWMAAAAIVALAFGVCTGTSAVFAMLAREARHQGTA